MNADQFLSARETLLFKYSYLVWYKISFNMEGSKFQLLDDNDLKKLSENASNKNTKMSTNTWLNVYKSWAVARSKNTNLEEYTQKELGEILCQSVLRRGSEERRLSLRTRLFTGHASCIKLLLIGKELS